MKNSSDIFIGFSDKIDAQDSFNLEKLGHLLEHEYDFVTERTNQEPENGSKDGGLTLAISIIGVSLSAIGTIISALSYWKSSLPKYSVSIEIGEKNITIDTNDPTKIPDLVARIESENLLSETKILIAKN